MTYNPAHELDTALALNPAWARKPGETDLCPTAQRRTDVDRWGFDNGPWASVFALTGGWGWVVWNVDTHKHERFGDGYPLDTAIEALSAADAALEACVADRVTA